MEKRGREAKDEQGGVIVDLRLRENIVAGGAVRTIPHQDQLDAHWKASSTHSHQLCSLPAWSFVEPQAANPG